jgi:hypothetical protein
MSIGWPAAIVLATLIMGVVILIVSRMAAKGSIDVEEAKGKYMEQYQVLADDYSRLAQETGEAQTAIRADIAALQRQSAEAQAAVVADVNRLANSVESIEAMMRDVG